MTNIIDRGELVPQPNGLTSDAQDNQDTTTSLDECVSQGKKASYSSNNYRKLVLSLKGREWGLMITALREISESYEKQARVARLRAEYLGETVTTKRGKNENTYTDRIYDMQTVSRIAAELAADIEEHNGINACNIASVRNAT